MDFSSIQPVDSDGVPIASYVLSFDRGSILEPAAWGNATFLDIMFGLYKAIAWMCLALVNMVSQFDWLSPFVGLLESVSDTVTGTLGSWGVFAMALGVMASAAALNWARRRNHRTLYQLGLMVVCVMVAITMVSPVRLAGHTLGLGRDIGTEVGSAAAQTRSDASLSMILADKLVREPTQRWNFGQSLDSLGCGQAWSDRILAHDQDRVKDAALSCPGGQSLHAYAMAPTNAIYDGFFALGSLAVFVLFAGVLMARMLRTGFATVIHASAVKPLTIFLPASPVVQNLFVRNALAVGLGACTLFLDVLIFICGAAFIAGMANLVGTSAEASVVTAIAMIGVVVGAHQFAKNLKGQDRQIASRISQSPGMTPVSGGTQSATQLARRIVTAQALHGLAPSVLTGALTSGRGARGGSQQGAPRQISTRGSTTTTGDAIRSATQTNAPAHPRPVRRTPASSRTAAPQPAARSSAAATQLTASPRPAGAYDHQTPASHTLQLPDTPSAESITAAAQLERNDTSPFEWAPTASPPTTPPDRPAPASRRGADPAAASLPEPPSERGRRAPTLPTGNPVNSDAVDQAMRSASAAHQPPPEGRP